MNPSRRQFVFTTASIPLVMSLPACGGGASSADGENSNGGMATIESLLPNSGGYIDIAAISGYSIDSVFRYTSSNKEYLRYFVPTSSSTQTQGLLNTSSNTAFISLSEVIQPPGSLLTYHRTICLELPQFPAVGASKTYNTSTAGSIYKGTLLVNTTSSSSAVSHYDYELKTGGIKATHSNTGLINLEFIGLGTPATDLVDGAPTSSQILSSNPPTTITLKSGSNLGANPFSLKTASSKPISVSYISESCSWM